MAAFFEREYMNRQSSLCIRRINKEMRVAIVRIAAQKTIEIQLDMPILHNI